MLSHFKWKGLCKFSFFLQRLDFWVNQRFEFCSFCCRGWYLPLIVLLITVHFHHQIKVKQKSQLVCSSARDFQILLHFIVSKIGLLKLWSWLETDLELALIERSSCCLYHESLSLLKLASQIWSLGEWVLIRFNSLEFSRITFTFLLICILFILVVVITTEVKNILIRSFYQRAEEKV